MKYHLYVMAAVLALLALSACSSPSAPEVTETPLPRGTSTSTLAPTQEPATSESTQTPIDQAPEEDPTPATNSIPVDDELARMAAVNVPPQLSERELGVHILPCEPNRVPGRDEVADQTYYCGVFTVPQNWDELDGRNLDLSFVVTRSTGENPEPDPLIFLAGGPGQSATVVPPIPYEKVRPSRDIIRLDQRGTGFSQRLGWEECLVLALQAGAPADQTAAVQAMMPNLDDGEEGIADVGAANRVCWEQFAVQGLDLNQFSTAAAARDVIEFIKALEYESFNIHGISYGTRLAMTIMEMLPMMEDKVELRSVLLDSPFPPCIYMLTSLPRSDHDFILQLLADCEADDACREAYPDLDRRLRALLDQLAVEPIADENELITLNDVVSVLSNPGNTRAEFVPKMIAELEMGVADTYIGLRDRTLGTVHPEGVAGLDRSDPVQAFVGDAVRLLAELGLGDQSFDWLFAVTDALAQDDPRTALQAYIDETFGDDVAEQLSDLLAGVTDEALATTTLVEAVMGGDSPSEDTGESDPEAAARAELASERMLAAGRFALPLYNTIHCREDIQFETMEDVTDVTNSLPYPEFVDIEKIRTVAEPCPTWPVQAADESIKRAVSSDVPTLILQGAYDRRTPVYMGELAADELANANLVLIPQQGHEVWSDAGSCAALIAAAFIADPQAPLDLSCLEVRQPRWSLPLTNKEHE